MFKLNNRLAGWLALAFMVAALGGAALVAQPPLTPTPAAAPGYTKVVVDAPVKATQDGVWTMRVADLPLRTLADKTAPGFIRVQRSYTIAWPGGQPLTCQVVEVRADGWIRALVGEGTRRREAWINTRQLVTVEEVR